MKEFDFSEILKRVEPAKKRKEELRVILEDYWANEDNRKRQAERAKFQWEFGNIGNTAGYYTRQYKLTSTETEKSVLLNGTKELLEFLGYNSFGSVQKQPSWPEAVHKKKETEMFIVEIIKNGGKL